jgi:hypothetical protein
VYELNFIKTFLIFLKEGVYHDGSFEGVYSLPRESTVLTHPAATNDKALTCSDLTDTFFFGTPQVIDLIMSELGNRDKTDRLAILFKDTNGMKFRALAMDSRSSIVSDTTWKKSTWKQKYTHLKRLGGVGSYMKTPEIEKMFVDASNGVYDVLDKADKKWNLQSRYQLWMEKLIESYNNEMKGFLQKRSLELYNEHNSGQSTGFTSSEVRTLERMSRSGTPTNFDMWWKRKLPLQHAL